MSLLDARASGPRVNRTPAREGRIAKWMDAERVNVEAAFGPQHWPTVQTFIERLEWISSVDFAFAHVQAGALKLSQREPLTPSESAMYVACRRTLASLTEHEYAAGIAYRLGVSVDQAAQIIGEACEIEGAEPARKSVECALYRHFDSAGDLLYVGIAKNPEVRAKQHAKSAEWWRFVARTEVEWHDDEATAALAERQAIAAEEPVFNDTHNRANRKAAIAYMAAALDRLSPNSNA